MPGELLVTTVVGSYPQPNWLVDPEALATAGVPRVREAGIWRIPLGQLEEAQDDATILAIRDMERAGVKTHQDEVTRGPKRLEDDALDFDEANGVAGEADAETLVGTLQRSRFTFIN